MALTTSAQTIIRNAGVNVPEQYWDLMERYRKGLQEQALALLNSPEDAEDVVQETFVEALRQPDRLKRADSIGAWLHAINRCNALNRLRGKRRAASGRLAKQAAIPEETFTTGGFSVLELRDSMSKALQSLPSELQSIVVLRYWKNLSYQEIAVHSKLHPGVVQRRLVQASNLLYEKLKLHLEPRREAQSGPGTSGAADSPDAPGAPLRSKP